MPIPAKTHLWHAFPALKSITEPHWEGFMARAKEVHIPVGITVFRAGEQCQDYLFVLDGSIRVMKFAENGREIVLYRVESGETYILTTSCLLADDRYPAEGITETDVHAFTLPASAFHEAVAQSDAFRAFVFAAFGERLTDLITLVESVALRRGDMRLAERLLELDEPSGVIAMTHHELASELGTAHEVVSRLLKEFERQGFVQLGRNRIEISNRTALEKLITTDR